MRGKLGRKLLPLLLALCFCLTALGAGDGQVWEDGFGDPGGVQSIDSGESDGWQDGFGDLDNGGNNNGGTGGTGSGDTDPGFSGGEGWSDGFQDGQPVNRALAALSQDPVAMMAVSEIGVTTSAAGCYVNSVTWYDANGVMAADAAFGTGTVRVEIQLTALDGYYFPSDAAGYINNSACSISWNSAGSVTLSKEYAPAIWAVTIINNPKSKTVDPGKWADFWVSGLYVQGYEWRLEGPNGEKLALEDIQSKFPNVPVPENYKDTLIINNVPVEMNGWKVICTFISAGNIDRKDSRAATITVRGAQPSPSPSPSASPSPSPSPSPGVSPSPGPESSAPPEDHEHVFPPTWQSDETGHWHECECGERTGFAEHTMTWTVEEKATKGKSGLEKGVCSVCGYETSRELGAQESGLSGAMRTFRIAFFVLLGLIGLGVVFLIVQAVRDQRGRRRRRPRH